MNTANIIGHDHIHNPVLCAHCCRTLVVPRNKLVEEVQEHLHVFGEIMLLFGKNLATLFLGAQFIVEAIFPHLNRQKHPLEKEYERVQKEWEAKREAEAQSDLAKRMAEDAQEETAYLNSLKLSFTHSKEFHDDAFLIDERNKLVEEIETESKDPAKDRITLRKYAVDVEQLRLFEMRQNERRMQLQKEVDYHVSEMKRWQDRAYAARDSKERTHCERESEVHQYQAYYANVAKDNI